MHLLVKMWRRIQKIELSVMSVTKYTRRESNYWRKTSCGSYKPPPGIKLICREVIKHK